MGPRSNESFRDSEVIAENLMENILNEALKVVIERTDNCCFDSFENLKLQAFGSDDILQFSCPRKEGNKQPKEQKSLENVSVSSFLSDVCYPSLANLPEVCVHTTSLSNTSKQGEGDFQHPKIQEATTFYRLEMDIDQTIACGSKDYYKTSPNSSLITETSHNELITNLQKEIDLSFENIFLSDVEADYGLNGYKFDSNIPLSSFSPLLDGNVKHNNNVFDQKPDDTYEYNCVKFQNSTEEILVDQNANQNHDLDNNNFKTTVDEQSLVGHSKDQDYDFERVQFRSPIIMMQQSQKFCQLNTNEYFPHSTIPNHYSSPICENNIPYHCMPDMREDEQELLSENSEELAIIETENEGESLPHLEKQKIIDSENTSGVFGIGISSLEESSAMELVTTCSPYSKEEGNICSLLKASTCANVEPEREMNNWEESIEIQVNLTEPAKDTEKEYHEENMVVENKQYWSNVGLMTEHQVNPRFRGLVETPYGLESLPGMTRVEETVLKRGSQQLKTIDSKLEKQEVVVNGLDEIQPNENFEEIYKEKVTATGTEMNTATCTKRKKKISFVSRMSKSFTNLFRSKKKNSKL